MNVSGIARSIADNTFELQLLIYCFGTWAHDVEAHKMSRGMYEYIEGEDGQAI